MVLMILTLLAVEPANGHDDLQFQQMQEQWIFDMRPNRSPQSVLRPCELSVLQKLGSSKYKQRIEAESQVKKMGPKAFKLLFWGSKSNDRQVVDFCSHRLKELFEPPEDTLEPTHELPGPAEIFLNGMPVRVDRPAGLFR